MSGPAHRFFTVLIHPPTHATALATVAACRLRAALFLRFNADQADADQLLAGLHAEPDYHSATDEAYPDASELDEYPVDDWNFSKPGSDYLAYTFGSDAALTGLAGWVIIDRSAVLRTVLLYSVV